MRTQVVTLKHGFKVGGEYLKDVVLREPCVGDMIKAESLMPANGGSIGAGSYMYREAGRHRLPRNRGNGWRIETGRLQHLD